MNKDEERAAELVPPVTLIEDRPIVEMPLYARTRVALATEIDALSMSGWVLLKAVPMDQVTSLQKTWPYIAQGNQYPSGHSYTDSVVIRSTGFVMGCPQKLVDQGFREEISQLRLLVDKLTHESADWKKKLEIERTNHAETDGIMRKRGAELTAAQKSLSEQSQENTALRHELGRLKEGMLRVVSRVGEANLTELMHMDDVDREIRKSVEETSSK